MKSHANLLNNDMISPIPTIYDDTKSVILALSKNESLSEASFASMFMVKSLILSSASYFESRITEIVEQVTNVRNSNFCPAFNFARSKGIKRQYHTWFNWDTKNINQFLSLFGEDFKKYCRNIIDSNDKNKEFESAFMQIGNLRNILIHNNFASYTIDLSLDDTLAIYLKANELISIIEFSFENFIIGGFNDQVQKAQHGAA